MPPAWRSKSYAFPTGYYELVFNHTDNDRRAALTALPILGALPESVRRTAGCPAGAEVWPSFGTAKRSHRLPHAKRTV